jgi:hypothetical protein
MVTETDKIVFHVLFVEYTQLNHIQMYAHILSNYKSKAILACGEIKTNNKAVMLLEYVLFHYHTSK